MTERRDSIVRVDLRALDAAPDMERDEAVMRAVMKRIVATAQRDLELARLLRLRRAMLAMAAVLAALAVGIAREIPRGVGETAVSAVAGWIAAGHVPSNGELLAALQETDR